VGLGSSCLANPIAPPCVALKQYRTTTAMICRRRCNNAITERLVVDRSDTTLLSLCVCRRTRLSGCLRPNLASFLVQTTRSAAVLLMRGLAVAYLVTCLRTGCPTTQVKTNKANTSSKILFGNGEGSGK